MEIVLPGQESLKQGLIRGFIQEALFGRLVSASFGLGANHSIFEDFPVWREENGARIYRTGHFVGNDLVACAGLRLASLRIGEVVIPVGVIGCVATDSRYRGRGFASDLVRNLTKSAENDGAAAVILFGSEFELYSRLGFERYGLQTRVDLDSLQLSPRFPRGSHLGKDWTPGLFDVLRTRPGGLVLEQGDERWVSRHVNADWRWISDQSGQILAYACIGKGIDLQGMVHEWGGSVGHLHHLLTEIRADAPGLQVLGCPKILSAAGLRSSRELTEPLCMAKPLGAARVRSLLGSSDFWLWGIDGA